MATARPSGNEPVHSRIRQVRGERGISRRQFADDLGIHYQTVGYLERGEFAPSLQLALRIAAYFDLPVEQLFALTPFPVIQRTPEARASAAPEPIPTPGLAVGGA